MSLRMTRVYDFGRWLDLHAGEGRDILYQAGCAAVEGAESARRFMRSRTERADSGVNDFCGRMGHLLYFLTRNERATGTSYEDWAAYRRAIPALFTRKLH